VRAKGASLLCRFVARGVADAILGGRKAVPADSAGFSSTAGPARQSHRPLFGPKPPVADPLTAPSLSRMMPRCIEDGKGVAAVTRLGGKLGDRGR
jgi:hypothetical protein